MFTAPDLSSHDVEAPSYLGADASAWDSTSLPPALRRAMRDRHEGVDRLADDVHAQLLALADKLGAALRAHIDGTADTSNAADVKAAVQATELEDVLTILREEGADDALKTWMDGLQDVAERAAASVGDAGLDIGHRILDTEAVSAALHARYIDMNAAWDARVTRPLAEQLLQGLHNMVLAETLEDATRRLAETARTSVNVAYNDVVTQTAMFDRFAAAEVTVYADPKGIARMSYIGPDDGITRPFCEHLVGKAFDRQEITPLNNYQTPEHPIFSGGGYRCRHAWVPTLPGNVGRYGVKDGTMADVKAANAAAYVARYGKGKRP